MRNDLHKYMDKHHIPGALLREFVSKGLWSAALLSCDEAIIARREEIERLKTLKEMIAQEVGE